MERAVCKSFFRSHFISFFPCFCKSFSLSLSLSLSSSCSLPTSSQLLDEPNANTPILILMLAFHHFSITTLLHQLTICDPCPNIYLFSYPFFFFPFPSTFLIPPSPLSIFSNQQRLCVQFCPVIRPYDPYDLPVPCATARYILTNPSQPFLSLSSHPHCHHYSFHTRLQPHTK